MTLTLLPDTDRGADAFPPWQPMDTAPKDGTAILASIPCGGGEARVAEIQWQKEYRGDGWWLANTDSEYFDPVQPTAWMPLPAPQVMA